MNLRADNFYAAWRQQGRPGPILHDGDGMPAESILQAVWQHQRLLRDRLKTSDGRAVRVLHPGFATAGGGPDFQGAILQFDDGAPVSGEVEVDLVPAGWHYHGHDRNPRFSKVILQVVWSGVPAAGAQHPPVLAVREVLDAPLAELASTLENEAGLPAEWRGRCCAPLGGLAPEELTELLRSAAAVRFQNKASALLARARQAGWEQALWEHLFRALGYKQNIWPMLHLAETKSRWLPGAGSAPTIQSRLLGLGGLLPADLSRERPAEDSYLRRAWDGWWRDRDRLANAALPRAAWKFAGVRPANHPQRRLALASHWLAAGNLPGQLENWCKTSIPEARLTDSLAKILEVPPDEYWSAHWTLTSAKLAKPQPLLGAARVTDLAVNVILPWLWVRAREGGNGALQRELTRRYQAWPAAEDNAVLKLARQRLLGSASPRPLNSAAAQQGLMQIVRDFCDHSNALCADCRFPELVRSWGAGREGDLKK